MRQDGLWAVGEDGGDCKDLLEGNWLMVLSSWVLVFVIVL
jgi:hypothetical protein